MAMAAAEPSPAAVMTCARGLVALPAAQTPGTLVAPVASTWTHPVSRTAQPRSTSRVSLGTNCGRPHSRPCRGRRPDYRGDSYGARAPLRPTDPFPAATTVHNGTPAGDGFPHGASIARRNPRTLCIRPRSTRGSSGAGPCAGPPPPPAAPPDPLPRGAGPPALSTPYPSVASLPFAVRSRSDVGSARSGAGRGGLRRSHRRVTHATPRRTKPATRRELRVNLPRARTRQCTLILRTRYTPLTLRTPDAQHG
jgi:hypothetical protein